MHSKSLESSIHLFRQEQKLWPKTLTNFTQNHTLFRNKKEEICDKIWKNSG